MWFSCPVWMGNALMIQQTPRGIYFCGISDSKSALRVKIESWCCGRPKLQPIGSLLTMTCAVHLACKMCSSHRRLRSPYLPYLLGFTWVSYRVSEYSNAAVVFLFCFFLVFKLWYCHFWKEYYVLKYYFYRNATKDSFIKIEIQFFQNKNSFVNITVSTNSIYTYIVYKIFSWLFSVESQMFLL